MVLLLCAAVFSVMFELCTLIHTVKNMRQRHLNTIKFLLVFKIQSQIRKSQEGGEKKKQQQEQKP